jgi:hypothetical protein
MKEDKIARRKTPEAGGAPGAARHPQPKVVLAATSTR